MDDSDGMCGADTCRDLNRDVERGLQRRRPGLQQVAQRLPLDVLHGDERLGHRRFAERVHHADVRMTQRRRGARFLLEATNSRVV